MTTGLMENCNIAIYNILDAICEHEEGQRDADCPLVDIQPHGRLIDADELKKKFPHDYDWDYPVNSNRRVNEDIDEAPTIVEAEGAKE